MFAWTQVDDFKTGNIYRVTQEQVIGSFEHLNSNDFLTHEDARSIFKRYLETYYGFYDLIIGG